MGLISIPTISDGTVIDANDVNNPLNTIVNEINGNLTYDNLAPSSVTESKIANNAVTTTKIVDDSVTAEKIDWASTGADGGIWWEEIGRTTLSSPADVITVSFPERKYLRILLSGVATAGTLDGSIKFNNDSGANYAYAHSAGFAAAVTGVSLTAFPFESGGTDSGSASSGFVEIMGNIPTEEKNYIWFGISQDAVGAATLPTQLQGYGKWSNTTDAITRVDWFQVGGTGDYAIGSEVIVLGHN